MRLVSNHRCKKGWQDLYHYGYDEGTLFTDLLGEVKDKVRIILIVGPLDSHLGLVEAVDELSKQNIRSNSKKINNVCRTIFVGKDGRSYFVIGVSAETEYNPTGTQTGN